MGGANEGGGGVFLVDVTEDGGGGSGGRNPPFELPADLSKVGRCNFIKNMTILANELITTSRPVNYHPP